MKKTLQGPNGISIVLDSAEIFPDDPGQGTPAMVYVDRHSATYWCAVDTGDLDLGAHRLTFAQQNWLEDMEATVSEFLDAN